MSSYNAVVYGSQSNATPMRANTGIGWLDNPANWLAYDNSFTSGVTDTAATWLAGGARLLGDLGDSLKDIGSRAGVQPLNGEGSQVLKDFANRADEVKRQVRINHDINRGDSGFSNFVYGAGRVAPEMLFPAGQITMGTGLAGNALRGAGYGALGGGLTSALDSDQSWEQALGGAAIGAGAGGLLGAVGASLLGKFTGHGFSNSPKAGLLNSTIDDAGNIKVDPIVGATNASDDAIARAMNAQRASQPNFVMGKSSETITNYNVPIEFEQWVKNAAGINPDKEIIANLYTLAKKHPEMFNKPSDVYRLIREVKNPTFFYRNHRPDIALMGKFLEDGKIGKIGIVKDGEPYNIVGHATTRNVRANNYQDVVGTADPTLPLLPYHGGGQRPGANAHSHLENTNPITPNLNNGLENTENAAPLGRAIGETNVYINNDRGYHATIQIVQADKLKPSFEENVGGQFRTQKQDHVIHKIRNHFDPMLMFERSGDFNGIPVVDNNGIVLVGNHRTEALKSFSPEQFDKYAKAVQDKYGIKLNNGELVVRVLDPRYNKEERDNLAKASNVGRENNFFEKEIAEDAKYAQNLGDFLGNKNVVIRPDFDEASDVVRMKNLVAGALKMPLDSERANSVLLHSLLQSGQHGFLKRLDSLALDDARTASAIHTMLRDNAGALYLNRISQNASAIDIVPYLHSTLNAIRAQKGKTYPQIKKYIEEEAKHILLTSEENLYRLSRLSEPPIDYFEQLKGNMIACALGKLLTRTNPSEALYGILKQFGKEQNHGENIFGDEFKITLWDNLAYLNRISGESPLGNMLESIKLKEKEFAQYAAMRDVQSNTQMSLKPNAPFDMKTMHKLKAAAINAPTATQQQYEAYYKAMWSGDKEQISKTLPFIKIAHFNETFSKLFGIEKQAVFFTKQSISHARESRKISYNQDLPEVFVKDIPNIINNAQGGFYDKAHQNFFIVKPLRDYGIDSNQLGFIHFNKDILGNYIVTMKRADADSLHHSNYVEVGRGIAPHIPTEQGSIASPFLNASPTSSVHNPTTQNLNNSLQSNTFARNLAHQAATNGIAGTAGGIANVALDDSDDSLALKFAKGFALGVATKVAAKHGMSAGAKASKQAFDYAMHKSAQFSTLLRENPQLFTRFLNKQLTDDFAQFGGARSGLHAECFAVAETLSKKGVSAEEILSRTGWFKGLDGEWKIQLDLRGGAAYKLKEGTYNLSQLFKQDSLYAAYPFLKKVRVEIAKLPENVQGSFEPTTGIITLNSANNKLDFTKALAHELQHVIQKYEGFAQGSSTKNPNYWTSAGEVEARATFKGGEDNPIRRLENEKAEGALIETYQKSGTHQNGLQHSLASEAQRRLEKIDVGKLNAEQKEILSVFKGEKDQATLQGKDINDLYSLESGSRKKGAKKILIKHYGIEKTGGLHDDELLGMMKIVRDGDINAESFSEGKDFIRYAYELVEQGDVRLKLVVDEFNDGKKIFDLYSSRNFIDETSVHSPKLPNRQENNSAKDIKSGLNVQHSQKLENAYLDKDTRKINTEALDRHAVPLPKALNEHEFMAQAKIDSRGIARVETPIGDVEIDMKNAWDHINKKNTYKQDRKEYSGALFSTLQDPLFVVKQQYTRSISSHPLQKREQGLGNSTSAGSITQDSYVFFKPYKDSNGSRYLAAFAVNGEGELLHKTFFDPNMTKLQRWIQSHNDDLLYYKYDNDVQHSLQSPLDSLKSAQGRINGLVAFAKYLANPPAHLRGDAQRLRADVSAMRELDMHTRQALTDKANAIDALAYQSGYPEPQYSTKNPRQKQKFAADSVGILQQIRAKSREGMEKIMRNSWVNSALGTRIYGENFADYRFMKDVFDKDIAANSSQALALHNKLKLLSEDAQRKMHHYMVGDTKGEDLSSELKALADSFRKEVRKETDELVKLGLLDKAVAEKWGDVYLLREYSTRMVDKLKRAIKGLASEDYGIGLDTIHMRGKKQKVSAKTYQEMLQKGEIGDITKGKWEVLQEPSKHEPHYILRRDYTQSEREKMGEIDLISYSLPRTLAKIQNQKRIATLFSAISKESDLAQKLEAGKEIPSGFRRLNGEQYGALKGFVVRNEVADDIERTTNKILGESKEILKQIAGFATYWKKTKTVHNPTSHFNNMVGNVFFLGMEGNVKGIANAFAAVKNGLPQNIARYEELCAKRGIVNLTQSEASELAKLDTQDMRLYKTLKDRGVFDKSSLNLVLSDYLREAGILEQQSKTTNAAINAYRWMDSRLSRIYGAEDHIFRFGSVKSLLERGHSLNEAIDITNKVIPDYSKPMPKWLDNAARYGVLPFVQFTYHATPIMMRQLNPLAKNANIS